MNGGKFVENMWIGNRELIMRCILEGQYEEDRIG